MSISTKTGDTGTTSLRSGIRVSKDSVRVEAYGTVDELDSHLGEAKHLVRDDDVRRILHEIQNDLMRVCGELATTDGLFDHSITLADAERLTDYVHHYEEVVKLTGFVVPGNTLQSAKLDICRTICRRAERRVISLAQGESVAPALMSYINRLSDCLFMLARFEEFLEGKLEYKKIQPKRSKMVNPE